MNNSVGQQRPPRHPFWNPGPPRNQALNSKTFCPPPLDGTLALPEIYDWHKERSPKHPIFVYARQDGTICTITYSEVVPAIYRAARLVKSRFEMGNGEAPTVAILSASETISFFTTQHGIMRANCIPFPISPRNSPVAIAHLIAKANVRHIFVGEQAQTRELFAASMDILRSQYATTPSPSASSMPVFEELFSNLSSADDGKDLPVALREPTDVAVYQHSSGSTSDFPKLIPWTVRRMIELSLLPYFGERDLCGTIIAVHGLPLFHSMGNSTTNIPAACGAILSCFEPQSPPVVPTADYLAEASKMTECDFIFAVPSFIEEWSRQPQVRSWLATRSGVLFGGGTLNKKVGDDMISEGVKLMTIYGLTEVGPVNPFIAKDSLGHNWDYFQFSSSNIAELVPQGDGTYELVLMSSPFNTPSVLNTMVRGEQAYATSDLLVPHPTTKGLWKVFGRCDDQIMHSTGEKTNPGPLESILQQDPLIQTAVFFGRGRFQAGVLVEPTTESKFDPEADERHVSEFRNQIWPTVERMNEFAPQHSRIFKEMILITKPTKPLTYTAKGTARRQVALQDYDQEISQLYATAENSTQPEISPPKNWDTTSSTDFVRAVVNKVLPYEVQDDADLFRHGCDSLQATWIRNSLLRGLRESINLDFRQSAKNFVYDYPSIAQLGNFLSSIARNGFPEVARESVMKRVQEMYDIAGECSKDFDQVECQPRNKHGNGKVVLVTGTTGGFGSYLLESLVADESVSTIYAINRSNKKVTLMDRQRQALREKEIDESILHSAKLKILEGDMRKKDFSMEKETFEKMRNSVTHIIHNAWRVHFTAALPGFVPNIQSLRGLIDFSLSSGAKLLFIASVGVFQHISEHEAVLLEKPVTAEMAVGMGYAESKWIAEQVLLNAIQTAGLHCQIVRLGQLCGDSRSGAWNMNEWAPAMIKSATLLGCLPVFDGTISWIPSDLAAQAILDLLDVQDTRTQPILHLRHPAPVPWSSLANFIASQLEVSLVPYAEWLKRLEESNAKHLVATRLLPFFQNIPIRHNQNPVGLEAFGTADMDIKVARTMCKSLTHPGYPTLGNALARKWLKKWFTGETLRQAQYTVRL
ncbi:hypothetical protein VNI00_014132 [Paramarasmius palmivorus]|uniref:Polyketide synthase-like phosphopantetheine-binding domain-containing protein n=1 Tax=Paramarasmius palmivorus TaxID=297713 RepID=A0AAW0BU61_9AGAR